jgi:hypothetical protein
MTTSAAIREKIKQAREGWLEHAKGIRKAFRERPQELLGKLPDCSEVINADREAALQSAQQSANDTRPHRGED